MRITKSLFVDYMDYPKRAWRKLNNPEIYKKICKIETQEQQDHIMEIGQAVEDTVKEFLEKKYNTKALDLMPHFHKGKNKESDDDDEIFMKANGELSKAIENTIQAIINQETLLYQPTFQYGDCLVRADFMVRNGKSYDLIECKAKSNIRKDITDDGEKKPIGAVEKKFINDVSFQRYVINNVLKEKSLGEIEKFFVTYLNKEYIKNGPLDINALIVEDLLGNIEKIGVMQRNKPTLITVDDSLLMTGEIETTIAQMKNFLRLPENDANKVFLRTGTKYLDYFGEEKKFGTIMGPGVHHSNANYVQELYYQNKINIADLTPEEKDGFNDNGKKFIDKYLLGKKSGTPIIDKQKISEIFDNFTYPLCFYDYESISVPIPFMDNTRPYMQTVVQYSLHKYYKDGTMKHYGGVFVGEGEHRVSAITIENNPNAVGEEHEKVITGRYQDLLIQMLSDIGDDIKTSTFIVRHDGFENSRNKEIAKLFPDLAESFLQINEKTYDLKKIFSEGYYFDIACKGSASIKKVLPVLVPSMSYSEMEIGRGDIAMVALYDLISNTIPADQRNIIIKNLLRYCGQDTLAMVKIFEKLFQIISHT